MRKQMLHYVVTVNTVGINEMVMYHRPYGSRTCISHVNGQPNEKRRKILPLLVIFHLLSKPQLFNMSCKVMKYGMFLLSVTVPKKPHGI